MHLREMVSGVKGQANAHPHRNVFDGVRPFFMVPVAHDVVLPSCLD